MKPRRDAPHPFVSRGGVKLRHALDHFGLAVAGLRAADLGCSTGGFTDCLLQAGAAHVTSIDTAYGQFAWKLRNDPRVRLLERTNAMHAVPTSVDEHIDLVVIDMGWTPQRLCLPAAKKWLRTPSPITIATGATTPRFIITLIKPHYELIPGEQSLLHRGVLNTEHAERITHRVLDAIPAYGLRVNGWVRSPIEGSAEKKSGNTEWLALLEPVDQAQPEPAVS